MVMLLDHYAAFQVFLIGYHRKLDVKQRQLERLEDQLHKLEIQATDKVSAIQS
jgi:hypothetical protein